MIDETKIIKKLQNRIDEFVKVHPDQKNCESVQVIEEFIELLESEAAAESGWIPCSERMPDVETEVLICTKVEYAGKEYHTITTAMYEDGTVSECDSCWNWYDVEGDWDEENDCVIIPEGWWEYKHFNADDVYNNAVDYKVIAWQPIPAPPESEE